MIGTLENQKAGALVSFEGWVRDHNEGKKVSSLEYQVYTELALSEGEKILREAREKFNIHSVTCAHRSGHLKIGEIAVWVGAVASHRDDAFRASRFVIDEIKKRLPVWKKEHYTDQEAKWVFCRDHDHHVHFEARDYYEKQKKILDQNKLSEKKVVVIGAGGLGCPVLTSLATAGVGTITFYDDDRITLSNIHRQPLYSPENVGEKKIDVAKAKLKALNPFIHLHGKPERVDHLNVEAIISGADLVMDCTDNLETKYLLHDACFKLRLPLISASIYQFEGQVRTFVPGKNYGCLRCHEASPGDDSLLGNCNDFGVVGAAVAAIGQVEALEAIFFLQNETNNTIDKTFYLDLKNLNQMKIKNLSEPECETCLGKRELERSDLEVTMESAKLMEANFIDVRERPDSDVGLMKKIKGPVVVYCHRGIRSKKIVSDFRKEGLLNFYSLKGGACSYSP
jgi:adenylyltransferase/sulfurtransferase